MMIGATDNLASRRGLEILSAKPDPKGSVADVAEHDLTGELRERYWIRQAADAGIDARTGALLGFAMPLEIERAELGRNRSDPGDGFRYVFRGGLERMEGRAEWFEVTEVFEGVEAKDIEAFMRLENGGKGYPGFDPEGFVRGLNFRMPRRAAQQRAADKVIAAVEKKLRKSSYEGLWQPYGYGTLIVGLPLWFATYPLDPLRVENVVDDFMTRVLVGLQPHARQLRKRSCPFWRIVVVWNASMESTREWVGKARLDVYRDPTYWRLGELTGGGGLLMPLLLDLVESAEQAWPDGAIQLHLYAARTEKRENKRNLQLPGAVATVMRRLDEFAESHPASRWTRIRWYATRRLLEVLCFVQAYGLGGLERLVVARLSPRRRIAHAARRRRALRLYRASRSKQRDKARGSRRCP